MTTTKTNLPYSVPNDSAAGTKLYFDQYGDAPLEFSGADVDAVIGFFTGKGFGEQAAQTTGMVLLKQAKIDSMPVFKLLDTLKNFERIQLSALVGEILNNNRSNSSTLGFKVVSVDKYNQTRNIVQ
jgi:hypothetical protein